MRTWFRAGQQVTTACVAVLMLLAGCGGDANDDEVVTVFATLDLAHGVDEDGMEWGSLLPAPDDSSRLEGKLRDAGVQTFDKRCATHSFNFGGELVLFPEAIPPTFVLFDISAADLERAKLVGFYLFDPDSTFVAKPFWKCEIRGY